MISLLLTLSGHMSIVFNQTALCVTKIKAMFGNDMVKQDMKVRRSCSLLPPYVWRACPVWSLSRMHAGNLSNW